MSISSVAHRKLQSQPLPFQGMAHQKTKTPQSWRAPAIQRKTYYKAGKPQGTVHDCCITARIPTHPPHQRGDLRTAGA
jgi:hypothetical protein